MMGVGVNSTFNLPAPVSAMAGEMNAIETVLSDQQKAQFANRVPLS